MEDKTMIRQHMTTKERMDVFEYGHTLDVQFALRDTAIAVSHGIIRSVLADEYSYAKIATRIKDKWEHIAETIMLNTHVPKRVQNSLLEWIVKEAVEELAAIGMRRKEAVEFLHG